ncbi:Glycosyltransferase KanE [Sedimentisphaera cyanobacteriorum]|uniref:Glycosyltransferase KanE n=1 Tax=Sedimentisphaera cyanobacteriorum TaxID=1940790 RepID=A0A1Q2HNX2_9BACT|nr:glycosyltransferase [Sedimentisphaera cyanobacteriorum]AQQ09157.1 Glycosyltransferase KanE [Sedimentisphaera cyanobacteriorum]
MSKKPTNCCLFNLAHHYRKPIYKLMDSELCCDFYFADRSLSDVKKFDYSELEGFRKELKALFVNKFSYQRGAASLVFKRHYQKFILTGEPYCISTWFVLLFAKILGKKTYLWTHGWYGREGIIKTIIKKVFFSLCTKVLLYGDYARNLMIKEGFKPDKLVCIYNSLDYDKQLKIREKLTQSDVYKKHFGNDNPVAVYIGRIQKIKRLDLAVEALNLLNNEGKSFNLVVIGKDNENTGLEKLVSDYGLADYVWFYGPCYEEEVLGELIYNADVCVTPGNIGLTVIHSFVYGTPVVTHNDFTKHGPEFEAIEEGVTGSFFDQGSTADLSIKLWSWLGLSERDREDIRTKCYKVIEEKYNPHTQILTIKKVLG